MRFFLALARIAHLLDVNVPASRLDEQITREAATNLGIAYTPYLSATARISIGHLRKWRSSGRTR